MLRLTYLEVYNSISILTEKNDKFIIEKGYSENPEAINQVKTILNLKENETSYDKEIIIAGHTYYLPDLGFPSRKKSLTD